MITKSFEKTPRHAFPEVLSTTLVFILDNLVHISYFSVIADV